MPIRELQYPVEPYSKANRLKERGEFRALHVQYH